MNDALRKLAGLAKRYRERLSDSERTQPNADAPAREKVCGKCGRSFPCGGGVEPCWCDQVRLNESHLTEIGQSFRDCLCPDCLQKISTGLTDS